MLPTNPPREPLNARNILNPTFYSRKLAEKRVKKQAASAKDPSKRVALSKTAVLPPGTFLGENASFLHKDGYEFFRRRAEKYQSPIFVTHLFAEPCIAITGAEEAKLFFDPNCCIRKNANAPHLTKYFFGRDTTSGLDGEAHITRKAQVMANFTPDHLARYTAIWARTLDKYLLRWAAASSTGPMALREELFNLHTEFAMAYILGIFDPTHEAVDQRRREIVHMIEAFGAVPHLKLVPRSRINKVNKARRSLQLWLLTLVEEQRQGLRPEGTILAAVAKTHDEHGAMISAELASAELLNHIRPTVIAAYLTTWMMAALHDNPHVLDRLRSDTDALLHEMPASDYYANKDWLDRLGYGEAIANEVRRFYPCVPLMMARVKRTFEHNGLIFPQGWSVILGVHGVHRDPRVYSNPDAFIPERFERGEHKRVDERFTVLQQSGSDLFTNHKCAGETLTTLMMKSLGARLVHNFTWRYSAGQRFGFKITDIPPTPADGVKIEAFQPRTSAMPTTSGMVHTAPAMMTTAMGGGTAEPLPIGMMTAGGFATRKSGAAAGRCPMGYDQEAINQPHVVADDEQQASVTGSSDMGAKVCPMTGATGMTGAAAVPAGVCPMGHHQATPTGAGMM